jgi:hypothetical protein
MIDYMQVFYCMSNAVFLLHCRRTPKSELHWLANEWQKSPLTGHSSSRALDFASAFIACGEYLIASQLRELFNNRLA